MLLPQGQLQCFVLGREVRQRYLDPATCAGGSTPSTCMLDSGASFAKYGLPGGPNVTHSTENFSAYASYLDRMTTCSRAANAGLFPPLPSPNSGVLPTGEELVPTHQTAALEQNEYVVRTYSKCPVHQNKLTAWYTSSEFLAKEADTTALRVSVTDAIRGAVGAVMGDKTPAEWVNPALKNWMNVYDVLQVNRSMPGASIPISNTTWAQVEALAGWLETRKLNSTFQGIYGMMPGLAQLVARQQRGISVLNATAGGAPLAPYQNLGLLHGTYGMLLSALSSFSMDNSTAWKDKIPPYTGALAIETYVDRDSLQPRPGGTIKAAVRLVLRDGPGAAWVPLTMPCASPPGEAIAGPGACTWEGYLALMRNYASLDVAPWCFGCNNTAAPLCVAYSLAAQLAQRPPPAAATSAASCGNTGGLVAGIVIVTLYAVGLTVGFVVTCVKRRGAGAGKYVNQAAGGSGL